MAEKVRYGVLSTARIARNQHVPAAGRAENSEVVCISSRDGKRAEEWAEKLGVPRAYGSYGEVLADPEVGAVINPLPNSMHCEWTVRAAEAGKHVLCEKPLAVTVGEADRMIDAARSNGVLLMEGFTQRFLPQMAFVRRTIDSGGIGEVRLVRAELTYTITDWEGDSRVRRDLAGGCLLDAGCYCVNTVRFFMGSEPVSVQGCRRMRESHGVDSTFAGMMLFEGGRIAYVATGMEEPFRNCCEVVGTEGRIYLPNLFAGERAEVAAGGEERVETFEPSDRFRLQIEHFSDCILNGRQPMLSLEDSRGNTAALAALGRAAEEGRAIALS
jgi:predicted dehydrogenase